MCLPPSGRSRACYLRQDSPTRDSELGGSRGLLCRRTDLEGTGEATLKTRREDPTDRTVSPAAPHLAD